MDQANPRNFYLYAFADVHLADAKYAPTDDYSYHSQKYNQSLKQFVSQNKGQRTYVVIPGDLTHNSYINENKVYLSIWENNQANGFLVCEGFGNHDVNRGGIQFGCYEKIAEKQAEHRRRALKDKGYIALSTKQYTTAYTPQYLDAYYRWSETLGGVRFHFIMLNLAMAENDSEIKNQDDLFFYKSKRFLENSLSAIGPRDPIFIFQHYGLGTDWWPKNDRNSFLRVISGYRVIAVICGHEHDFYHTTPGSYTGLSFESPAPRQFVAGSANADYSQKKGTPNQWRIIRIKAEESPASGGGARITCESLRGDADSGQAEEPELMHTETILPPSRKYLQYTSVKPGDSARFDFDFEIDERSCLAGLKDFYLSLGPKDHHVKNLGVSLRTELNADRRGLTVWAEAILEDNSRNGLAWEESFITIGVLAFPKTLLEAGGQTESLSALSGFKMSFGEKDHHLMEYGLDYHDGQWTWHMADHSSARKSGPAAGKTIKLPKSLNLMVKKGRTPIQSGRPAPVGDRPYEDLFLINAFKVCQGNNDSHVCQTGIINAVTPAGVNSRFTLEDEKNNKANGDCFADGCWLAFEPQA